MPTFSHQLKLLGVTGRCRVANIELELKKSPRCASHTLGLRCPVCHPPALGVVEEWAIDTDLLVMGGLGSGVFSSRTSGSATS
jgi:hypothetical protein